MNGQRNNGAGKVSRGGRIAALHEQGRSWAAVIVEAGTTPTLVDAKAFAAGATTELESWLRTHKPDRLIRIAPITQTLARCVAMPPAGEAETASALALLGEAELPETVPVYRRGAGILPRRGDGVNFALVTGWVSRGDPPTAAQHRLDEFWIAPIAALATLAGPEGRSAILADETSGGICVLAVGSKRAAARVLIESPEGTYWRSIVESVLAEAEESVGEAVSESAGSNDVGGPWINAAARASLPNRITGTAADQEWLATFGLALGAALAAVGDDTIRSWASLHANEPRQRVSIVEATAAWLAVPRHALAAGILGLLLAAGAPLGIAWGRHAVLVDKAQAVEEQKDRRKALARDAALYAQLQQTRWPMTKLMADISAATPVGVTVSSLRLSPDQGLSMEGSADSTELVNTLQQSLNATGLFRDVRIDRSETVAGQKAEFVLSAAVVGPHTAVRAAEDFASKPLAVRLYGEGASNREFRESSGDRASADRGAANRRPTGPTPSAARQTEPEPRSPRLTTPDAPPAPLTEEQIKGMDRNTAMREWVTRNTFLRNNRSLESAMQQRLEDEVTKLRARMDETR